MFLSLVFLIASGKPQIISTGSPESGLITNLPGLESIFSLSGELLFSYRSNGFWGGAGERYAENSSSETEMKIDKVNKTITLIENSFYTTKKGSKKTKETVGTYQYGNGTITEIPTPKPAIAIQKTTAVKKTTKKK